MVRTQVQLTDEQHARLKKWARERGISLAEAVRRFVADRLTADDQGNRDSLVRDALAVLGKYADAVPPSNVAKDHDAHLARSYRE